MDFTSAKSCREQRGVLCKQLQDIVVKAKQEERPLSAEEQEVFDRLDAAQEEAKRSAESFERIERFEGMTLAETRQHVKSHAISNHPVVARAERNKALKGWFLAGSEYETEETAHWADKLGYNRNSSYLHVSLAEKAPRDLAEARALSEGTSPPIGSGAAGGYTVATDNSMMSQVEVALLAYGGIRQVANVIRTETGANLPIPMNNDTGNLGFLVAENALIGDVDLTFSQVVLSAYKYSSGIQKVSLELLQDSAFDLPSFIGDALGTRIARAQSVHFTTGTGSGMPQGVAVAATAGPTSTSTLAAGVSYKDLLALYGSVDPAYRDSPSAAFMFSDAVLQQLKGIVDSSGRPLWQPGLAGFAGGQQDTILGKRFVINQQMPAWGANATGVVLFGDFDDFVIRDVKEITVRRLDERYAEYGMVAWVALARADSRLLDAGSHPVKALKAPAT